MGSALSKKVIGSQLEKLKAGLEAVNNDLSKMIERTQEDLNALKSVTLDIAITGDSGAGKSSFVNALRGLGDNDEGAAETGTTQTTMKATAYPHPTFPNVTLYDLPGVGTPEFNAKKYLQEVNLEKYDFFLIVASGRFTENDVLLAREIQNMGKKFYYVRTKVDQDITNEKRKKNFSEEKSLNKIKNDCCDNLKKAGESRPRVFLISVRDLDKFDFLLLVETLEEDLDEFKRWALISVVSNVSKAILKKKKAAMEDLIWRVALVSSVIGTVPILGLFFAYNIPFLEESMRSFSKAFGLDEGSLCRLANQVDKPVYLLRSAIRKTRTADKIDSEFVKLLLRRHCMDDGIKGFVRIIIDFIPVLGSVCGGRGLNSIACLAQMLQSFLDDVQEDAENVWATAFENLEPQTQ